MNATPDQLLNRIAVAVRGSGREAPVGRAAPVRFDHCAHSRCPPRVRRPRLAVVGLLYIITLEERCTARSRCRARSAHAQRGPAGADGDLQAGQAWGFILSMY